MIHSAPPRRSSAPRALALALALLSLAACNLAPLGQAETPTTAPAATARPTAAEADLTEAPAATPGEAPLATGATSPNSGPALITGDFTYSNDIITTYNVEHAAALVDMYGFVTRDQEWEIPVDSQTLGYMTIDEESKHGEYRLQLPERPLGQAVDVDNDGEQDAGVQVFVTTYWPNYVGSPFSAGDDRSFGWPSYLASTVNDTENEDEVIGGKLVVWSPDGEQQFPTGFGDDAKLFTDDDPVGPIPAGWSVVDLDEQPFAVSQDAEQDLALHEPADITIKDFSKLGYADAFKQMVDKLRLEYAFNGIPDKGPNWDELYATFAPRVEEAERNRDPQAFFDAIQDFTRQFKDGHVGIAFNDLWRERFLKQAGGGYGFVVRELDDGRAIVVYVLPNGPADRAGMAVGAELTEFNGQPAAEAIGAVQPFEGPFSTDFGLRIAQQRYLVRVPVGTEAEVTFKNPGASAASARLTASDELQSYFASFPSNNGDPADLPVEARTLESGFGYIKITSNLDDLGLIIRLFERALKTFERNQAPGVIIDMRQNPGGANLGLAGFLTDQEIPLGQTEYYSEATGKFEPEGTREKVRPNETQYRFDKLALLVGPDCTSACEIESYGFSKVPGTVVVGQYPTGGVEAEVARGQYKLPENIDLQFPTGRITLPDGSLFLEGQGVQPTVRVPIDEQNVLAADDAVLKAAEAALSK
jgi:C-terminal processing protease CtpA/Prc